MDNGEQTLRMIVLASPEPMPTLVDRSRRTSIPGRLGQPETSRDGTQTRFESTLRIALAVPKVHGSIEKHGVSCTIPGQMETWAGVALAISAMRNARKMLTEGSVILAGTAITIRPFANLSRAGEGASETGRRPFEGWSGYGPSC